MGIVTVLILALNVVLYVVVPKGFFPAAGYGTPDRMISGVPEHRRTTQCSRISGDQSAGAEESQRRGVGGFVGGTNAINTAFLVRSR